MYTLPLYCTQACPYLLGGSTPRSCLFSSLSFVRAVTFSSVQTLASISVCVDTYGYKSLGHNIRSDSHLIP